VRARFTKRFGLVLLGSALLVALSFTSGGGNRIDRGEAASQYGDDRFGVTLFGNPQALLDLGVRWFITGTADSVVAPVGANWVQSVYFLGNDPVEPNLAQRVAAHPGSYWLMSNEPNAKGTAPEQTGEQYARSLHDAATKIKQADPSAKIVGPNIINFDFTCVECPGFASGHEWMDDFISAYQADFATLPPLDVWSIHTYPLDWKTFPQADAGLMEAQMLEFRKYLDGFPRLKGVPIWNTEFGTHWSFEGLKWQDDNSGNPRAVPVGSFRTDLMLAYEDSLVRWMMNNGPSLHLERWFFYSTYVGAPESWETVYGGMNLVDSSDAGAHLTPFGNLYRQLAGLPR
jgi:putative glycosyl hydrolase